ncbi:MAG: DUF3078 domain-containing protein [Candidatus Marinimicrobia bacterium]|nr:DUF3078 domain-containing protein [Candidatus Neomarinimicrobiota bacterium]
MKKVLLLIVSLLFSALLVAQDDAEAGWKKGGQGAFNFSQTALSNWSGGGESALSLNTFLSMFANYQKEKLSWDNDLDLAYGLLRQEKETRKTDDRIELSSKFGYRLAEHWSYSSVLGFKTQMMPGYDSVLVSSFAAPAYLQISTGAEYKAGDHFSLLLAPLSGKMTLVADTALSGNYGLDPGKSCGRSSAVLSGSLSVRSWWRTCPCRPSANCSPIISILLILLMSAGMC